MNHAYLLGLDVGSSSVKASLVDVETGCCVASAFFPKQEAPIKAVKPGWAEQDPRSWWQYATQSLALSMKQAGARGEDIKAIGISYQMHGLVCVDSDLQPVRDSIIWCDSRAVPYGERAMQALGKDWCLEHLLNSPGNFTAAKLAWVKEHEPEVYRRIYKVMLPGDYIAMRLSGKPATTISGLSEGMMWDFKTKQPAFDLLDYYGFNHSLLSEVVPTSGVQATVSQQAADELGLRAGTPIGYRAGDQPNNALSLGVLNPGEIAATAGTSGVVYGVLGEVNRDPLSRVNTFAHVNYSTDLDRLGVLLCINGTGILNAWMRRNVAPDMSYSEINDLCASVPVGSEDVTVIPFGNGAERVLENKETSCSVYGLDFNRHSRAHLLRAAQEGIVFSFAYGMEIMRGMGMDISTIHAGKANMMLSPVFRQTLATVSDAVIELHDTDGSVGAARGAGIGTGIYKDAQEAFATLQRLEVVEPSVQDRDACHAAYERWKNMLKKALS